MWNIVSREGHPINPFALVFQTSRYQPPLPNPPPNPSPKPRPFLMGIFLFQYKGNGYYIYIEASLPVNPGYWYARLLSPRMTGPTCMTLYYHMYGLNHMGSIDVIVYLGPRKEHKIWTMAGNQNKTWKKATLSIDRKGEYQVQRFMNGSVRFIRKYR